MSIVEFGSSLPPTTSGSNVTQIAPPLRGFLRGACALCTLRLLPVQVLEHHLERSIGTFVWGKLSLRWLIPTVGTEHKLGYNQNKVFVEKQEKGRVMWIGLLITNVAHGVRSMDLSSSRKCFA
ncbi:hypothetical protein, partial [Thermococcus sp.]|uniref:hypothetical protein n=1 Tax=Thermococcus sp. TaxID=35749 RepID=UPI0025EF145C